MKKTEIQTILDENIPDNHVKTRQGGSGKTLSYLESWYVIDRMNQVFGQGNWGYQLQRMDKTFEGKDNKDRFTVSYIATVSMFATIDGKTSVFSDVGYGDGTDAYSAGKAHELATKEAVSDAVKRTAKNYGRSMGLALYDKTQEFVGTTNEPEKQAPTPTPVKTGGKNNVVQPPKTNPSKYVNPSDDSYGTTKQRPIKELVTGLFKVLESQGKITAAGFKAKYQKGKGLSSLTPAEMESIYTTVKSDFPQLNQNGVTK